MQFPGKWKSTELVIKERQVTNPKPHATVKQTFYHPRMRTGNNFSQICLCTCVSVWSDFNFWTAIARKLICSIQIHLDHISTNDLSTKVIELRSKSNRKWHTLHILLFCMLSSTKKLSESQNQGHSMSRSNQRK